MLFYMVATIEKFIFDSESVLLERVYESQRQEMTRSVFQTGMQQILEDGPLAIPRRPKGLHADLHFCQPKRCNTTSG